MNKETAYKAMSFIQNNLDIFLASVALGFNLPLPVVFTFSYPVYETRKPKP